MQSGFLSEFMDVTVSDIPAIAYKLTSCEDEHFIVRAVEHTVSTTLTIERKSPRLILACGFTDGEMYPAIVHPFYENIRDKSVTLRQIFAPKSKNAR